MSKSMAKKIQPETVYTPNNSRELFGLITLKNNHKSIRGLRKALGDPSHHGNNCLLYTSPSPRDLSTSRMPSSA